MSHLPHVLDYRAYLLSLGVTDPEQLNQLAQEPYVTALIRYHFQLSTTVGFSADQEEVIWQQLDRWNKVSPIKATFIFESAKYRMNTLRKVLTETGCLPAAEIFQPEMCEGQTTVNYGGEVFCTLVDYLVKELVTRHE